MGKSQKLSTGWVAEAMVKITAAQLGNQVARVTNIIEK